MNIAAAASWDRPDHACASGISWHASLIPVTAPETDAAAAWIAAADVLKVSGFQLVNVEREGSIC
ncbi:hypothetical protein [Mycolicibacterium porcinum]|uniref:hypothetical protein n=1 Tax=Mycolicibacterium porcinum TaxID=39693 RepID=UPI00256EF31C|nr:hypothetical protein [Mycolicibacterium porcinum]